MTDFEKQLEALVSRLVDERLARNDQHPVYLTVAQYAARQLHGKPARDLMNLGVTDLRLRRDRIGITLIS